MNDNIKLLLESLDPSFVASAQRVVAQTQRNYKSSRELRAFMDGLRIGRDAPSLREKAHLSLIVVLLDEVIKTRKAKLWNILSEE